MFCSARSWASPAALWREQHAGHSDNLVIKDMLHRGKLYTLSHWPMRLSICFVSHSFVVPLALNPLETSVQYAQVASGTRTRHRLPEGLDECVPQQSGLRALRRSCESSVIANSNQLIDIDPEKCHPKEGGLSNQRALIVSVSCWCRGSPDWNARKKWLTTASHRTSGWASKRPTKTYSSLK